MTAGRNLLTTAMAAGCVLSVVGTTDALVCNVTDSLPTGLYARTFGAVHRGSVVRTPMPEPMYAYLARFPVGAAFFRSHDLLKEVSGVPGDTVCEHDGMVSINGRLVATAMRDIKPGVSAPAAWEGCATLDDAVFLLGHTPDSLDSRYFGSVPLSAVRPYTLVWNTQWARAESGR